MLDIGRGFFLAMEYGDFVANVGGGGEATPRHRQKWMVAVADMDRADYWLYCDHQYVVPAF